MELNNNIRLKLINGLPIYIDGLGKVFPQKIKEIAEFGEDEYNRAINLIVATLDDLEFNGEVDTTQFTYFEYLIITCMNNKQIKTRTEWILSVLLKEQVTLIDDLQVFYVGDLSRMNQTETTKVRLVDKDTFEELADVVRFQNNLTKKEPKKKPSKPVSDKIKALQKKRKQGQEMLKKARGNDFSLADIVSALGVLYQDLNKIQELTIYQLNNQYEKFMRKENYENQFQIYLTGADSKQLDLKTHWTSKKEEAAKNDTPPAPM